jgi:hypothetical protein
MMRAPEGKNVVSLGARSLKRKRKKGREQENDAHNSGGQKGVDVAWLRRVFASDFQKLLAEICVPRQSVLRSAQKTKQSKEVTHI